MQLNAGTSWKEGAHPSLLSDTGPLRLESNSQLLVGMAEAGTASLSKPVSTEGPASVTHLLYDSTQPS